MQVVLGAGHSGPRAKAASERGKLALPGHHSARCSASQGLTVAYQSSCSPWAVARRGSCVGMQGWGAPGTGLAHRQLSLLPPLSRLRGFICTSRHLLVPRLEMRGSVPRRSVLKVLRSKGDFGSSGPALEAKGAAAAS